MTGLKINLLVGFLLPLWACLMFPEFGCAIRACGIVLSMVVVEFISNGELGWRDWAADIFGVLCGELIIYFLGGRIV